MNAGGTIVPGEIQIANHPQPARPTCGRWTCPPPRLDACRPPALL